MHPTSRTLSILLPTLLLAACATTPAEPASESPGTEPISEPRVSAEPVSPLDTLLADPSWLEEHLEAPNLLILHVGEEREDWAGAHIPGQIFLPFENIARGDFTVGFELPPLDDLRAAFEEVGVSDDVQVVLTGDRDGLMATRAFFSLEVLGRTQGVALLDGGLAQWLEDGRPLSDIPAPPERRELTTQASAAMVVDADFVEEHREDLGHQLVDARPSQEHRGEVAGDGVDRPGHIPGAINIFWKETLEVDDRPKMKSKDAIAEIYGRAGVTEDATIIAYCRTGLQASFGYFLGRLLDRPVLIYDGSYVDWQANPDRPVNREE